MKFNCKSFYRQFSCRASSCAAAATSAASVKATATATHAYFIGQDGRTDGRNERGKEFKKWRSQSCEKKSVRRSLSRPAARRVVRPPLPLLLRPVLPSVIRSARRPLLVNSFPNVQIPRLSVVLEFFQVQSERDCRTKEGRKDGRKAKQEKEKKSISAALPPPRPPPPSLSLFLSFLSEHRQLLRDGRGRRSTDEEDRVSLSPPARRVNPRKDAKPPTPPPQGHHSCRIAEVVRTNTYNAYTVAPACIKHSIKHSSTVLNQ